jgi:O-antigen/teichoic acid export membrane protein
MKNIFLKDLFSNNLLKSFSIVFFGSLAGSILNYIFHIFTGRILGPAIYGDLVAIIALITIFTVPFAAIKISLTKEVARLKQIGEEEKINFLLKKYFTCFLFLGFIGFIIFSLASEIIGGFIKVNPLLIVLAGFSFIFSALFSTTTSFLNGLQSFGRSMISGFFNSLAKLLFVVFAVMIGYGLTASVISFAAGGFIGLLLSMFYLRKEFFGEKKIASFSIKKDFFIILIVLFCFNALNNLDIVLASHFLSSTESGIYGAASQIGKIIFFFSGAIALVLIPKAVQLETKKQNSYSLLIKTIIFATIIAGIGLFFYIIIPDFLVNLLYGQQFIGASNLIFITGLAMTFFTITSTLVNYFIAINRKKFVWLMLLFIILQGTLISFFHANPTEIALMLLYSNIIATILLLTYSLFDRKNKKIVYVNSVIE